MFVLCLLGTEPEALCMVDRCFLTELQSQSRFLPGNGAFVGQSVELSLSSACFSCTKAGVLPQTTESGCGRVGLSSQAEVSRDPRSSSTIQQV